MPAWFSGQAGRGKTHRQRMLHEITPQGLKALRQHLSRPVTRDDVIWHMDDLMMRFAFMDGVFGREEIVQFLQDWASQNRRVRSGPARPSAQRQVHHPAMRAGWPWRTASQVTR